MASEVRGEPTAEGRSTTGERPPREEMAAAEAGGAVVSNIAGGHASLGLRSMVRDGRWEEALQRLSTARGRQEAAPRSDPPYGPYDSLLVAAVARRAPIAVIDAILDAMVAPPDASTTDDDAEDKQSESCDVAEVPQPQLLRWGGLFSVSSSPSVSSRRSRSANKGCYNDDPSGPSIRRAALSIASQVKSDVEVVRSILRTDALASGIPPPPTPAFGSSVTGRVTPAATTPSYDGMLPLHFAALYGASEEVTKELLRYNPYGASAATNCGSYPLHMACKGRSSPPVVRTLLDRFPKAARRPNMYGRLPLHNACAFLGSSYLTPRERLSVRAATSTTTRPSSSAEQRRDGNESEKTSADEEDERATTILRDIIAAYPEGLRQPEQTLGRLPLHLACHSRALVGVVRTLIDAFPDALRTPSATDAASPLQVACWNVSPVSVLEELIKGFPEALRVPNRRGKLPVTLSVEQCLIKLRCAQDRPLIFNSGRLEVPAPPPADPARHTEEPDRQDQGEVSIVTNRLIHPQDIFHDIGAEEMIRAWDAVRTVLRAYPNGLYEPNHRGHTIVDEVLRDRPEILKPLLLSSAYPDEFVTLTAPCNHLDYDWYLWESQGSIFKERADSVGKTQRKSIVATPLHIALARSVPVQVVTELHKMYPSAIRTTSDLPCRSLPQGRSSRYLPLHVACGNGNTTLDVIEELIRLYGGALCCSNGIGQLPFHVACFTTAEPAKETRANHSSNWRRQNSSVLGKMKPVDRAACSIDVLYTLLRQYPEAVSTCSGSVEADVDKEIPILLDASSFRPFWRAGSFCCPSTSKP